MTKNKLPRLVASDIGGTLVYGNRTIPPFTSSVLNLLVNNQIPVALITGYNYIATQKYTRDLDEKILLMPQNGTLCIKEQKLVWEYRIPEREVETLHDFLKENNLPIIIYKGKTEDFRNYYISAEDLPMSNAFQKVNRLENSENITGISTFLPDTIARTVKIKIEEIVGDKFKVIYTRESKGSWLEVVHADVRKDIALKRLCEELSIPLSEAAYFGDNLNDLEALRIVGYPVIVENAQEELKKEFSTVVKPVTEEGAAHYLNEWFNLGLK
jgi:Cof subfamily protein (haloacid dehalogenase superfamily)